MEHFLRTLVDMPDEGMATLFHHVDSDLAVGMQFQHAVLSNDAGNITVLNTIGTADIDGNIEEIEAKNFQLQSDGSWLEIPLPLSYSIDFQL